MSFIAAALPANAPFSPTQRAWLDGFLAGFLADGDTSNVPPADMIAANADGAGGIAETAREDFPWHDPALALDERLALAAGHPSERVLMAAMAQLDCGQCGYLCQSYAEAIARGDEKQLTRCVPGGKATSRALRELLGSVADATTMPAAAAATAAFVAPSAQPAGPPAGGIMARLVAAHRLNGAGSQKDTRQIVLAAESGGLA